MNKRTAKQIVNKDGQVVEVGEDKITVRPLPWDWANAFEDLLFDAIQTMEDVFEIDTNDPEAGFQIVGKLQVLLREDLLKLAAAALHPTAKEMKEGFPGKAEFEDVLEDRMEGLIEKNPLKGEIIQIIVAGLEVNYGYIKNLMTLAAELQNM